MNLINSEKISELGGTEIFMNSRNKNASKTTRLLRGSHNHENETNPNWLKSNLTAENDSINFSKPTNR
jgi:hypothetical protein